MALMHLYDSAKLKIDHIESTLYRVLDGDFPFESGRRALQRILKVFEDLEKKLDRAKRINDGESIEKIAEQINSKTFDALPTIGFVLRSTNVRNAFELLYPFQSIADLILQGRPRLLMSSEWDYVPFAYPQTLDDLANFVLIGMPASEANNALISPLAAHEIGHAVWKNRGIAGSVSTTLQYHCEDLYKQHMSRFQQVFPEFDSQDIVAKETLPESIALSLEYAAYQAEELFCDMFAYAIFGSSYIWAFSYIVSPGFGSPSPKYPTYYTRIGTLQEIAASEGVAVPQIGDLSLSQATRSGFPRDKFIIEMSELSVIKIKKALWTRVLELISQGGIVRPTGSNAARHLAEFRLNVPGCNPVSLGDIINAGWQLFREDIIPSTDKGSAKDRFHGLNELVFKTIEVLEFRKRTDDGLKLQGNSR